MKKLIATTMAALMLLGVFAGCGDSSSKEGDASDDGAVTDTEAEGGQLNLYTWEGMFPQEIISGFEEESGYKVNYVNFDYDETMLSKLEVAEGGDYDLVIADDYIIETVIEEGLAQKLDTEKLNNYDNINPVYQSQFYDPENEYTVPYGAGVQTIVYNPEAIDFKINGYEDLWNEGLEDNIGVIANYRVVNGMALKVNGESYNVEDEEVIEQAGKKLMDLAPNIRIIKDDNLQDDLISGEVAAAVMYTSQVTIAKMSKPELEVVYPTEGIGYGIMASFIPSKAPNADAAYAFLDYIMDGENAASCFEYIGYYSTNSLADEHIKDEFKNFLTLPDSFDTESMEMIQNIAPNAEEAHSKAWTGFKTACGQ